MDSESWKTEQVYAIPLGTLSNYDDDDEDNFKKQ